MGNPFRHQDRQPPNSELLVVLTSPCRGACHRPTPGPHLSLAPNAGPLVGRRLGQASVWLVTRRYLGAGDGSVVEELSGAKRLSRSRQHVLIAAGIFLRQVAILQIWTLNYSLLAS